MTGSSSDHSFGGKLSMTNICQMSAEGGGWSVGVGVVTLCNGMSQNLQSFAIYQELNRKKGE